MAGKSSIRIKLRRYMAARDEFGGSYTGWYLDDFGRWQKVHDTFAQRITDNGNGGHPERIACFIKTTGDASAVFSNFTLRYRPLPELVVDMDTDWEIPEAPTTLKLDTSATLAYFGTSEGSVYRVPMLGMSTYGHVQVSRTRHPFATGTYNNSFESTTSA